MAPARSQGTVSASIDEPNSSAMNPKISVNRLMKIPNCAAYARTFQNPIATQTQMAARTSAQNAWPHCASGNDTALPTNVKSTMPRKTSIRQISASAASPAPAASNVIPIGRWNCP